MSAGDGVRDWSGASQADRRAAGSAPLLVAGPDTAWGTALILFPRTAALPAVWTGPLSGAGLRPDDAAALLASARPCSLLPEHGEGWFGRPGLSGHRLDTGAGCPAAGRDWSPRFQPTRTEHDGRRARVEAADAAAGLRLVTEIETVPGGAIRARHTLTNTASQPYVVDSLEVVFPLPGRVGEVLDVWPPTPPATFSAAQPDRHCYAARNRHEGTPSTRARRGRWPLRKVSTPVKAAAGCSRRAE